MILFHASVCAKIGTPKGTAKSKNQFIAVNDYRVNWIWFEPSVFQTVYLDV